MSRKKLPPEFSSEKAGDSNGFKLMQELLGQHGNILSCLEVFEGII
jgi:hypothetical protein